MAEPKLPEGVDLFRAIFADSDDVQQKPAVAAATRADAVTKSGDASLEPNSKSGNTETVTSNASPALTGVSSTAEQTAALRLDATSRRALAQLLLSQTPIATGCSIAAATSAQTRPTDTQATSGEAISIESRVSVLQFANEPHSNPFNAELCYAAINCCSRFSDEEAAFNGGAVSSIQNASSTGAHAGCWRHAKHCLK